MKDAKMIFDIGKMCKGTEFLSEKISDFCFEWKINAGSNEEHTSPLPPPPQNHSNLVIQVTFTD